MKLLPLLTTVVLFPLPTTLCAQDPKSPTAAAERSLVTDEPRAAKGKPIGAADYVANVKPTDGQYLALTMQKLENGLTPNRPFVIWALGSSYTNMLGNGEFWQAEIPRRFPNAPPIEYRKMVGNSCPWQYLRGWARHLVIPDQPDLILIYTIGKPEDLEALFVELRTQSTADIIVPSIHWRERDQKLWGHSENAADQDVARVREVCRKYGVEFIENRRDWGAYLKANQLPIPALLQDAVHQSDYGAKIINSNILAHLRRPTAFRYDPASRERRIQPIKQPDGSWQATFVGNRIDLIGNKSPNGGTFKVLIDGQTTDQLDSFLVSYVQPNNDNARVGRGSNPRDQSPHGITLGTEVIPQHWSITMTSDTGDFQLTGSVTGADGSGNAFRPFTSNSGQIIIEPELWRRPERNRTGDRFDFDVRRAGLNEIDFQGNAGESFVTRVAQLLQNKRHTLKLVPTQPGEADIVGYQVFQPPLSTQ